MTSSPEVKACCAAVYESDLVRLLLGDSYHPGGLALTRRLAAALDLSAGDRVIDVASGIGTTAMTLASELGVAVHGVDLSAANVASANARARERGLDQLAEFVSGDAEDLPFPDGWASAVVCECALCTFPSKERAAAEMARVVHAGGRVGITDVVLDPDRLDPELRGLLGWVACLADARPTEEYEELLSAAGLTVTLRERHDHALARMIDQIDARLAALALARIPALEGIDIPAARRLAAKARQAVDDGVAGYVLLVAYREPD